MSKGGWAFRFLCQGDDPEDVDVHRNPPESLAQRRHKLMVADPEVHGALYMRVSPGEMQKRVEGMLDQIGGDDPEYLMAEFHQTDLGKEGASDLRKALARNTHLKGLFLAGNKLGQRGARQIAKALVSQASITRLDLQMNKIGPEGAQMVGEMLERNQTLTELNLAGNEIGDAGCEAICRGLIFNPRTRIKELNLGNNRIGPAASAHVGRLLGSNHSIKSLYLWHNRLGNLSDGDSPGLYNLARTLAHNHSATTIDLSYNNVQPSDFEGLITGLTEAAEPHHQKEQPSQEPRELVILDGNLIPMDLVERYRCGEWEWDLS